MGPAAWRTRPRASGPQVEVGLRPPSPARAGGRATLQTCSHRCAGSLSGMQRHGWFVWVSVTCVAGTGERRRREACKAQRRAAAAAQALNSLLRSRVALERVSSCLQPIRLQPALAASFAATCETLRDLPAPSRFLGAYELSRALVQHADASSRCSPLADLRSRRLRMLAPAVFVLLFNFPSSPRSMLVALLCPLFNACS